ALGAAILLTKVNVGLFAVIALVFACVTAFSSPSVRVVRPLVYICLMAAPPILMMHDLSTDSVVRYAIVVSLGALTLVATATAFKSDRESRTAWILPLTAGAEVLAGVVVVVMLLQGVGLRDVIDGAFISAAHQRSFFSIPL